MKDLIIIGAGPAGLSAAIYGMRSGLDLILIDKFAPGGQVLNTADVENYPGFKDPIQGYELVTAMEGQARRLGAEIKNADVKSINKNQKNIFSVEFTNGEILESKAVIAATGSSYKHLNIPGEKELTGKGVSYCATCDGAFFRDKVTAVIGGGNTALEEALFLTKFASKVYIIHRRDEFRGEKVLQKRIEEHEKIEPILSSVVESINGNDKVESLTLKNVISEETSNLDVDGAFIFVGYNPNTELFADDIKNEQGQLKVDLNMETPTEGLFAAGDIRHMSKRQIVMAAADGATAAMTAYEYITHKEL